jgi:hypothetical protein
VHQYRPIRRYAQQVQRKSGPRLNPRLAIVQIMGLLTMIAVAAAGTTLLVSPNFEVSTVEIHGANYTGTAIVKSILGLESSPNVFRIATDRAASEIARLPAVLTARVDVKLPSTVVVTLTERTARMIWVIGQSRYVVDQDGVLFGMVDEAGRAVPSNSGPIETPDPDATASPTPSPTPSSSDTSDSSGSPARATETPTTTPKPTATPKPTPTPKGTPGKTSKTKATPTPVPTPTPTGSPTIDPSLLPSIAPLPAPVASGGQGGHLPIVFDRRASDAGLGLGDAIDPVNLDAGYRIAGLVPDDLGSEATSLGVVVDDQHGFTLSPQPPSWVAEFGFYAPTVRKTSVIPVQVNHLRIALWTWGESHVAWIRLVADVSENRIDTVILK